MAWGRWRRATWLVVVAGAAAAASARARRMMTVVDASSRSEMGGGKARVMFALDALGPKGTKREGLRYYATAFLAATQFGRDSSSVLEIGCASNAFVGRMAWIEKKTCVAPYHAGYANADGRNGSGTMGAASDDGVEYVGADFATWRVERAYDFCVCMQVLEHVDDPTKFLRKMLDPRVCRRAVLVSVPYKWGDCGEKCSHRWHGIDEDVIGAWSGVREPAQTTVIREREGTARLIVVYALNESVVV